MIDRRQLLVLGGLAAAALALPACSGGTGGTDLRGETTLLDLPYESTVGVDVAAAATAALGWELLLTGTEPNRAIAPSSLSLTLALLAEGATGNTLASLDAALGLEGDARSAALGALRQSLTNYDQLPDEVSIDEPPAEPLVHQASQVLVIGDTTVEDTFLDRIAQYFDASATRSDRSEAQSVLDGWASEHTAGLVEKSAVQVDESLALVLQDAVLFAAAWEEEFPEDTTPLDFEGPDGRQQVLALSGRFTVAFAETDHWQAVRLPYDDALAMDVILPVADSPTELTTDDLEEARTALDGAADQPVVLTMPPADLTTRWSLLEPFTELFGPLDSTLDGIFDGAVASEVSQQVRLMVDAKGTVGAAVTEVAVPGSAPGHPDEPVSMVVDRPFVMRVLDTRTGWPLFLAIVGDAAAAAAA
ncbi:serpin family protein [Tessaracoccus terricola]